MYRRKFYGYIAGIYFVVGDEKKKTSNRGEFSLNQKTI